MTTPVQTTLPRFRGFNLMELFTPNTAGEFQEDDFRWISEWGFNFVRIPMSYRLWTDIDHPSTYDEAVLEKVDRVVRLGEKYHLHVSLNLHRAPGYCINPPHDEPFDLWKDSTALEAFCTQWEMFSLRYKGISSEKLSFDLVNEPPAVTETGMTLEDYIRVVRAATDRIRSVDSSRLVVCEGVSVGNNPVMELASLGVAQSCRGYIPAELTHYKASWVDKGHWPEPTWPGVVSDGTLCTRETLEKHYEQWADLARLGVGVHCGEMGVYRFTPHRVALAWMHDVLDILTGYGIGFSLWNFRTDFGILDTNRADVDYEDWYGHKLDRKMLTLLQSF